MTTIAADSRSGEMACDSEWTDGDTKGLTRKVWRIHGALIGFAGDFREIVQVREWFKLGCVGPPPRGGNVGALILDAKGLQTWTEPDGFCKEESRFFAIGSGGHAARAAMHHGATVRQAVRTAAKIDPNTGPSVRVYRLHSTRNSL